MKFNFQFSVILAFMLALTVFSCKDDDGPSITGAWIADTLVNTNCTDANSNVNLVFDGNGSSCGVDATTGADYCITQDAVFTDTRYTLTANVTAILLGITVLDETTVDSGTYTIDSDTEMTFTADGGSPRSATYTLTDTKLMVSLAAGADGCETVIHATRQ